MNGTFAAARLWVDAVVNPRDTRKWLARCIELSVGNDPVLGRMRRVEQGLCATDSVHAANVGGRSNPEINGKLRGGLLRF